MFNSCIYRCRPCFYCWRLIFTREVVNRRIDCEANEGWKKMRNNLKKCEKLVFIRTIYLPTLISTLWYLGHAYGTVVPIWWRFVILEFSLTVDLNQTAWTACVDTHIHTWRFIKRQIVKRIWGASPFKFTIRLIDSAILYSITSNRHKNGAYAWPEVTWSLDLVYYLGLGSGCPEIKTQLRLHHRHTGETSLASRLAAYSVQGCRPRNM